jgi:Uma2 family endonuclease
MSVELQRRRFTVDEYYAMAAAGILTEDDRVELIEGEIIEMASIGSEHAACVNRLNHLLVAQVGDQAVVTVQNPVRLSDLNEPQPDIAVARPRKDFYAKAHPGPADALLVIEVAHTTLGYDRGIKLPIYARTGVPEVWIVDVDAKVVEVYAKPVGGRYQIEKKGVAGDVLRPQLLPDVAAPVERILG